MTSSVIKPCNLFSFAYIILAFCLHVTASQHTKSFNNLNIFFDKWSQAIHTNHQGGEMID